MKHPRRWLLAPVGLAVGLVIAPLTLIVNERLSSFAYRELGYQLLAEALAKGTSSDAAFVIHVMEFVNENVYPGQPIIDETAWTDFVRSIGWCDQMARDVAQLLAKRGIPARGIINAGPHHSVGEVWLNGKWRFYDAQNNYLFRHPNGELATYEEVGQKGARLLCDKYDTDRPTVTAREWGDYHGVVIDPTFGPIRQAPLTDAYTPLRAFVSTAMTWSHRFVPGFARIYQDLYVWVHPQLNAVERGRHYELFQRFDKAEGFYRRALAVENLRPDARFHLGRLLVKLGRSDEAIRELTVLQEEHPQSSWRLPTHYFLGEAYRQTNQIAHAVEQYRQLKDPYWAGAYRISQLLKQ